MDDVVRARSRARKSRMCRAVAAALAVGLVALAGIVGGSTPAGAWVTPTPPPQPAAGQLGGEGPCTVPTPAGALSAPNADHPTQTVWVFAPGGTGVPRTGGTCGDNRRPTTVVVHGWATDHDWISPCDADEQTGPASYGELIANLVSNGHVVIFPNYCGWFPLIPWGTGIVEQVRQGALQGAAMTGREATGHLGVWGHSYGAGMAEWVTQQLSGQGWGASSLWMAAYAPYWPVPAGSGPIDLPDHARALVVDYDDDELGVITEPASAEHYNRIDLPAGRKRLVTVRSDNRAVAPCPCVANHFTPNASPSENHLAYYGTYRNVQAVAGCARAGLDCGASLSFMGTWSDGVPAPTAQVTGGT